MSYSELLFLETDMESQMKDDRLKVGSLSLPTETRGAVGTVTDKVGSVSSNITDRFRTSDTTDYTTTETTYTDVGTPLEFYLNRASYCIVYCRADLRNNNANDDGSTADFRLRDTETDVTRVEIVSFGEFAEGATTTWLNAAQKFDFDILFFTAGLHNLTPQLKVGGTGTARLFRMDYGIQVLGN
jgi:hypothetical protein